MADVIAVGVPLDPQPTWRSSVDPRHPRTDDVPPVFDAYYEAPRRPIKNRRGTVIDAGRPCAVRIVGPITGSTRVVDSETLRLEAVRLLDVAATLDALQSATIDALDTGTLFE